jgi:hypothetical protein
MKGSQWWVHKGSDYKRWTLIPQTQDLTPAGKRFGPHLPIVSKGRVGGSPSSVNPLERMSNWSMGKRKDFWCPFPQVSQYRSPRSPDKDHLAFPELSWSHRATTSAEASHFWLSEPPQLRLLCPGNTQCMSAPVYIWQSFNAADRSRVF